MDEKEFRQLLKKQENFDLDFKLGLPEPKKTAQLVTAFYNSPGGRIVPGIGDISKEPAGLKYPQKTEHKFVQIIRHRCKLDEEPKVEFVKYLNKDFIIIHCPKGKDIPYFVRGEYVPRVRIGSSSMPANKEEIARLYREGSLKSQDIFPVEINPGESLRPLKVSEILKDDYIPKTRNKILVEVLSRTGMMDKRGTGFLRIREAMKKWNLPAPQFKEKQGCFIIRFNNPAVLKIPEIDESGLNNRQKRAIEYLKIKGKITTKDYIGLVKTSLITAKRDLLNLKDKKIARFVGAPKTGYYCLNDTVKKNVQKTRDYSNEK